MANGLAKITVIGNLGADPKAGTTKNGNASSRLRVGCTVWALGEERTTWYTVSLFGKQAEFVNDNAEKGAQVAVHGVPWMDSYEKDGETVSYVSILADDVKLLGSKGSNGNGGRSSSNRSARSRDDDDSMPF